MGKFWIEDVTDCAGNRYWVLFTHGMFHEPTAVIDDQSMRNMAEKVLNVTIEEMRLGLPEAVKLFRGRTGISQQDLADRAGLSRTHISNIERGVANYTEETRRKLLDAMKIGGTSHE